MKTGKVTLPTGAVVEITRPGVLGKRTILGALPGFVVAGKQPKDGELKRDQLIEFYDYQIAIVRAFTKMDDDALEGLEAEDFVALYNACQEMEDGASKALDPTLVTQNSS